MIHIRAFESSIITHFHTESQTSSYLGITPQDQFETIKDNSVHFTLTPRWSKDSQEGKNKEEKIFVGKNELIKI